MNFNPSGSGLGENQGFLGRAYVFLMKNKSESIWGNFSLIFLNQPRTLLEGSQELG